jgi:hypothetical protein
MSCCLARLDPRYQPPCRFTTAAQGLDHVCGLRFVLFSFPIKPRIGLGRNVISRRVGVRLSTRPIRVCFTGTLVCLDRCLQGGSSIYTALRSLVLVPVISASQRICLRTSTRHLAYITRHAWCLIKGLKYSRIQTSSLISQTTLDHLARSPSKPTMFSSNRKHTEGSFSKHRASKSKSHKKNPSFKDSPRRVERMVQHAQVQSPQSNQTSPTLRRSVYRFFII